MSSANPIRREWIADPPAHTVLHFKTVRELLGLSLSELAMKAKLSRTCIYQAERNVWPLRSDPAAIRARLQVVMQAAGAAPDDLAVLWHAPGAKPRKRLHAKVRDAAGHGANKESELDVLLPKQTMTAQAGKHFKLFRNPFDGPVDRPEQFFASDEILYVREALRDVARNSGFMALVGESGAGKTTVLADLEERLLKEAPDLLLIRPSVLGMEETERVGTMLKSGDILHAIITAMDPAARMPLALQARTVLALKLLSASAQIGNAHLLVIEEAHGMPDSTMKHLKRLHEMRQGRRSLLGVLMVGQTELKKRLADGLRVGTLREVAQRCEIVELLPLGKDLRAYLECRAQAAGRALDSLMAPDAVALLSTKLNKKLQQGMVDLTYPLLVGNACTRAMNIAAELGVPIVTSDVVKAI